MKKKSEGGFLLVELMMAAAVLGTGLFFVFQGMASALRGHQAARDAFEASLALNDRAWAWRQTGAMPAPGEDPQNPRWSWEGNVNKEDPFGETLSLTVSWKAQGRPRELTTHDSRP